MTDRALPVAASPRNASPRKRNQTGNYCHDPDVERRNGGDRVAVRRLNAFVLALFLALGLVVQGALPAHGCSCMMPDPFAGLAEADGAFVGTLVEVDRGLGPITNSGELVDFRFEVEASLKGDIGEAILVKSSSDGASCGIELPVGERAGFLLTRDPIAGEWEGNLCWTMDADLLLSAAEGPPEPVQGSPPHLVISLQMGDAGLIALDQEGQIVGYGEGPMPWLVSACPDDETFIGTGDDTTIRVWSFTNLAVVGEYQIDPQGSPWVRNLICAGPGGNPYLAVTELSGLAETSLIRYADGNTEVLAEDIEQLISTSVGLVAIGSDGVISSVDADSGSLTALIDSIGDVRGQLGPVVVSPDGSHLALSVVNWNVTPPQGRAIVLDLESRTAAETEFACDIYPTWVNDEEISIWDTCDSEVGGIYGTDLELIREGPPPADYLAYGWTVTDENGAVYYPGDFGMSVVLPGDETGTPFGQLTGYPSAALLVPEAARAAWTGSEFQPGDVLQAPPVTFVEPIPIPAPGEAPLIPGSANSPAWLMVVGAVMVGGVIWLLVRKPRDQGTTIVD